MLVFTFYCTIHLGSKYDDIFMLDYDEHKYIIYSRISFVHITMVIFYPHIPFNINEYL